MAGCGADPDFRREIGIADPAIALQGTQHPQVDAVEIGLGRFFHSGTYCRQSMHIWMKTNLHPAHFIPPH